MARSNAQDEMLSLLSWLQAMGVDAAVDETAHDWLSRGNSPPGGTFAWPSQDAAESAPVINVTRPVPGQTVSPSRNAPTEPARPRAATPLGASEAETGAR